MCGRKITPTTSFPNRRLKSPCTQRPHSQSVWPRSLEITELEVEAAGGTGAALYTQAFILGAAARLTGRERPGEPDPLLPRCTNSTIAERPFLAFPGEAGPRGRLCRPSQIASKLQRREGLCTPVRLQAAGLRQLIAPGWKSGPSFPTAGTIGAADQSALPDGSSHYQAGRRFPALTSRWRVWKWLRRGLWRPLVSRSRFRPDGSGWATRPQTASPSPGSRRRTATPGSYLTRLSL